MTPGSWRERVLWIATWITALVAGADLADGRTGAGVALIVVIVILAVVLMPTDRSDDAPR